MKNLFRFRRWAVVVVAFGFAACSSGSAPVVAGTYVNTAQSEVSLANDTLIVEAGEGGTFLLHRHTGYRLRAPQGGWGGWHYEREEWTAAADPQTGVLTESRHGKVITFRREQGTLSVGRRVYRRID